MQLLIVVCLLSTFFIDVVPGSDSSNWGYDRTNGPQTWRGECDVGDRQSPIDIRLSEVNYALVHRLHLLHYDFSGPVEMTNNGRTLVMTGFDKWDSGRKQPIMRGGGLKHTYRLIQLHFHWGHSHGHGSEHTLNGLSYPAELHLVHVREGLDVGKASNVKDGLAVLGVWLVEGENDSNFAQISDNLHYLLFDGNRTSLDKFYPRRLLPERTASFYRYEGSLTTPGCNEAVIWTILADPLTVSSEQLHRLRGLRDKSGGPLHGNYRPVQPLNGRTILFRPYEFDRKLLCSSSASTFSFISVTVILITSFFQNS